MRLVSFNDHRLGVLTDRGIADITGLVPSGHDLADTAWMRFCRGFADLRGAVEEIASSGPWSAPDAVALRAPVINPSKIIAAACNYGDHVTEMKPYVDDSDDAWLLDFDVFLKAPSSICDPDALVELPDVGPEREVHHEVELALVIGQELRNVSESEALDGILGYTTAIDLTLRGRGDRSRRKSYDGFTPVGPCLVTPDEVADPHDLGLRLRVNGETRQDAHTSYLLVTIPAMVAYASRVMTLKPGDLFTTGTPAGVGRVEPGDAVVAEVDGIGQLHVGIAREPNVDAARPKTAGLGAH